MHPAPEFYRKNYWFRRFLAMESAGGILIMAAAALAMLCANSPLRDAYAAFLHLEVPLHVNDALTFPHSLGHWINDALMAVFFFMVGMEIKRELMVGQLSSFKQAILPFVAAVGGVAVPALIFVSFNAGQADAMRGWAIPTATDIAFALGVLTLLGSRVPLSLKVFLTAVAVIDDLIAIIIIAVFYTDHIALLPLAIAGGCLLLLLAFNFSGVRHMAPYLLIGLVLWVAVLQSGVHATIAGVLLGLTIPLKGVGKHGKPLLESTVSTLHPWVGYGILPLFAFANAGVAFDGLALEQLADPVPLGIAVGLFAGKQIGIFTASALMIAFGLARKPEGASWAQFYAVCIMCGIGFTMSLFVGSLSYTDPLLLTETKLGVLMGSLVSGIIGYITLRLLLKQKQ
jgi:Na+:H+ antiporter, NhaA family